jgi:hypothetical protein
MIDIRPTRPEDLPALSVLFAERFGHPLGLDEWTWKYRQLPGDARSLVAVEGGEVLAHAGALHLPARWQGGDVPIWQLADFAGTPRRAGLRPPLIELGRRLLADLPTESDAPWIFGFPSDRHFRLGERVFNYLPLFHLTPLGGLIPEGEGGRHLLAGDSCGPWADPIWDRCHVLGVRRSAAFLNWRYYARPHRYYRFYRLFDSHSQEGLAVFAFIGDEAWAAEVWLPEPGEWYPAMLAVAADLRASGLRSWRFWPPPDPRLALLYAALGLRELDERRFIGCRGRVGGPDPRAAAAGFYYAMGDYDLV